METSSESEALQEAARCALSYVQSVRDRPVTASAVALQRLAYNINMLVGMPGQQYSGRELRSMLTEAGFRRIEVKPTFGNWSIVTGVKP